MSQHPGDNTNQQESASPMTMADLDFGPIREKYELSESFPPEVERAAATASDAYADSRIDARDLALVTIDPPGSKDLDQAVLIERGSTATATGFTVFYAIADVGAFVQPGDPIDVEARKRGETVYLPDGSVPLHPRILTEVTASLVAGVDRPAVLWQLEFDETAALERVRVRRATVHVRERLDYPTLQAQFDRGEPLPESVVLLPQFGDLREQRGRARGSVELQLPEQDLVFDGTAWQLMLEPRTKMDAWNAECSLATGFAAARIMLSGGVGLLRTLPAPDADTLRRFFTAARALGIPVDGATSPGELLASLDPHHPTTLALNSAATRLLRGSGYLAFECAPEPDATWHAGVASEYAHATAPIRRLGDRFVSEICLAFGREWVDLRDKQTRLTGEVPEAIRDALPELAGLLQRSGQRAGAVSNAAINLAEAVALQDAVGQEFDAGLLRSADGDHHAEIFVYEPPVIAQCRGEVPAGEQIRVRLTNADVEHRKVRFEYPAT